MCGLCGCCLGVCGTSSGRSGRSEAKREKRDETYRKEEPHTKMWGKNQKFIGQNQDSMLRVKVPCEVLDTLSLVRK